MNIVSKRVYEFQVHLMVNGEYLKNLQTLRICSQSYEGAEYKLNEFFKQHDNVVVCSINFICDYNIYE